MPFKVNKGGGEEPQVKIFSIPSNMLFVQRVEDASNQIKSFFYFYKSSISISKARNDLCFRK